MSKVKMNDLVKLLEEYRSGKLEIDVEDIVWEAVKLGFLAVPLNNSTYLCKDGVWLIKITSNGEVEYSSSFNYYNVIEDVV